MKQATMKRMLIAAVLPFAGVVAMAGIQPVGEPIPGGSWGQCFQYETPRAGLVDLVAVQLVSGGPFESPTFRGLEASWELLVDYPELAAAGTFLNPVSLMSFEVWFDGEPEDDVSLVFGAWYTGDEEPFEAYRLTWNGAGAGDNWAITSAVWPGPGRKDLDAPAAVAPGAALLGAIGLGVLGWFWRRAGEHR